MGPYFWCAKGLDGRFDRLLAEPPAEVVPAKVGKSSTLSSAVVPVWITVRVPADAAAGEYKGTVTIEATGASPVKYTGPVELQVIQPLRALVEFQPAFSTAE